MNARVVTFLLLLFAGCLDEDPALGTTEAALLTEAITPPATAMERPERVYVLPVLWVPQEQWGDGASAAAVQAKANLATGLRIAQQKYMYMLRNKTTGAFRGTFGLATWDARYGVARVYNPLANTLEPLIIQSSIKWGDLPTDVDEEDPTKITVLTEQVVAEVLDVVGCKAQSCPFVFVIMIAQPGEGVFAGIPFNYGFNGGGGYIRVGMSRVQNATSNTSTFQSALLHELGHSFGLRHMNTYSGYGADHQPPPACMGVWKTCPVAFYAPYCYSLPVERRRLEFHCSPSIMSYSKLNQTAGCLAMSGGTCTMPADWSTIDGQIPGELVAENLHNLALNQLVFPELAADYDLLADDDNDNNDVDWHTAFSGPDGLPFPGQPRLQVSSPHTAYGSQHRASFGYHSKPIEPAYTSFHGERNWHSNDRGPGGWTYLDFDFPEPVVLGRVRAYTGYDQGLHAATELEVLKGTGSSLVSCGDGTFDGRVDGETNVMSWGACAGGKTRYRIFLRAGGSGHVVVRGLRFFDELGGELQAPRMPIATSAYGHPGAHASSPQHVVGWDQYIGGFWHGFDADTMWHSKDVGADNWVSIDVRLPNLTLLSALSVYTGHSSQHHAAARVQIEYRDAQGNYVALTNVAAGPYAMIPVPPTMVTHLRVAFRAGPSGHVVVRGIRMFNAHGELHTPLAEFDGWWPLD